MPAANNTRIYHAVYQCGIRPGTDAAWAIADVITGLQSFSMDTAFNLQQYFQIGMLELYENAEDIPDITINLTKFFDGQAPMYLLATQDATTSPTISGRSTAECIFGASFFDDTLDSADGLPQSQVEASGCFAQSVSFNYPVDGAMSEELTLVSNQKQWANDTNALTNPFDVTLDMTGGFPGNTDTVTASGGIQQRENLMFDFDPVWGLDTNSMVADPDATILPPDIYGISTSGTNEKSSGDDYDAHVQNIRVSADLGREPINELGRKAPFTRPVTFPVEVTTEIEVLATSGDLISGTETGILSTGGLCTDGDNLTNRTIRIASCDGTRLYMGIKNKLASVNMSGADATGGNMTATFTYSTFNDLTVVHSSDPSSSGAAWWSERESFLSDT